MDLLGLFSLIMFLPLFLQEFLNGEELLDDLIDKIHEAADAEALLEVIKRHSSRMTNV